MPDKISQDSNSGRYPKVYPRDRTLSRRVWRCSVLDGLAATLGHSDMGCGSSGDADAGYIPSMRAIAPAIPLSIHPTRPAYRTDLRDRPRGVISGRSPPCACTQVCAKPLLCGMSWKANVRPRPSGDAPQIRHTAMARLPGSLPSARAAVRAVRHTSRTNPTTASAWDRWEMSATPQPM